MPNIIIREIDNTTAGSSAYSNFSVAMAGPAPVGVEGFDQNGILECSDYDSFKLSFASLAGDINVQMAKELLNMGYTILYKKVGDTDDIETDDFWEAFQDRANYDFRYILQPGEGAMLVTHTTAYDSDEYTESSDWASLFEGSYCRDIPAGATSVKFADITNFVVSAIDVNPSNGFSLEKYFKNAAGEWSSISDYPELASTSGYTSIDFKVQLTHNDTAVNDPAVWSEPTNIYQGGDWKITVYYRSDIVDQDAIDIKHVQTAITKLAFTRRDCFAICDVPSNLYMNKTANQAVQDILTSFKASAVSGADDQPVVITDQTEKSDTAGKYAAYFMPRVTYTADSLEDKAATNRTFPAGFHYLACAKKAFLSFAEWYAVAGYTRGVSNYQIEALSAKFGDAAINKLQPRTTDSGFNAAINIITSVKNSKYMWGNRTAYTLGSTGLVASHFLNIRQLCCTIKKEIYQACRKLTFDPNSDLLWLNFKGMIEPMLDRMQNDQGINGYELTKYTPKDAVKGKLYIRLRISPIEAVEDFDITIMLEDSNVELGE